MKKATGFLMMAALLIGFAACNNEDVPEVEQNQEGDSFAGLTISTRSASGTRALAQDDKVGREAESTVAKIDLLSSAGNKNWTNLITLPATYPVNTDEFYELSEGKFTVSPWPTTDGTHNMALLLNWTSLASKGTIEDASNLVVDVAVSILAAENEFTMSSKTFSGNVLPGISAATIATSSNTANVFNQDVERVVAQGIVIDGATDKTTTDKTGTLSDLTYGGAMGATETYLYADHAGDRTMTGTRLNYAGYTSAVHTQPIEPTEPSKFAKAELTSLNLAADASSFTARGFYFLENSMPLPDPGVTDSHFDWKYSRSAYAKIYGTFTPAVVYEQVGETNTLSENSAFETRKTFYKGEKDGLFYATAAAARLSPDFPNQKSYMYKDGKVVYRSLWNRVMDVAKTKTLNGNTRRNNIYVLKVTAFAKIGMNYDPNDPEDPNIKKPTNTENPDEPTTPLDGGDPTVDKQDTYMTITSTILPWNKVDREVILQ